MFSLLGLPYLYIYTKRREEEEEREAHSWFRTIKSGLHGEIEESLFFLFKTPPQRRESTAAGPFVVALFKRRRPPADIFKSAKGAVVNARCQNRQHFFKRVTWPPSPVVLFSSGGYPSINESCCCATKRAAIRENWRVTETHSRTSCAAMDEKGGIWKMIRVTHVNDPVQLFFCLYGWD